MRELQNPHDRFFRSVFSEKENARDLLLSCLPERISRQLDLDSVEVSQESFIDGALSAHQSDILIRTKLRKSPLIVYILVEHKSHPYRWTIFQLLRYMVCIWEKELAQSRKTKQLTPIIPVIFYHGRRKWKFPLGFEEYFSRGDALANELSQYIPDFKAGLFDVRELDDEHIRGGIIYRAALRTFKHALSRLSPHLKEILQGLSILPFDERLKGFLSVLFRYILEVSKDTEEEDIAAQLRSIGSGDAREAYMTIAERLMERGKLEGEMLEKQDVLLRLLEKKFGSIDGIAKAKITNMRDRDKLNRAIDRLLDAETIDDVLQALD